MIEVFRGYGIIVDDFQITPDLMKDYENYDKFCYNTKDERFVIVFIQNEPAPTKNDSFVIEMTFTTLDISCPVFVNFAYPINNNTTLRFLTQF